MVLTMALVAWYWVVTMIVVVMVMKLGTLPLLCCAHSGSDGNDGGCAMIAMAVVSDGVGGNVVWTVPDLELVKL